MIEAHVVVPSREVHEFYGNEGSDFKIINFSKSTKKGLCFFHINITEEQLTFLKLKYGVDRVWQR
jgi:hypothetical protein